MILHSKQIKKSHSRWLLCHICKIQNGCHQPYWIFEFALMCEILYRNNPKNISMILFFQKMTILCQICLIFDFYSCPSGSHLVFAHRSIFLQKLNWKVFRDTFGVFVQKEKVLWPFALLLHYPDWLYRFLYSLIVKNSKSGKKSPFFEKKIVFKKNP